MYINTVQINFDRYGSNPSSIKCYPYSKVLHVHVKSGYLVITYSSEMYSDANIGLSGDPYKTFYFKVLTGLIQTNMVMERGYEYFDTIRVSEDEMIQDYHIFMLEHKTVDEVRDEKLNKLMDQEF